MSGLEIWKNYSLKIEVLTNNIKVDFNTVELHSKL